MDSISIFSRLLLGVIALLILKLPIFCYISVTYGQINSVTVPSAGDINSLNYDHPRSNLFCQCA